ncbi:MAG: hypothetical protein ACLRM9_08830 [Collinsella aerofaciens]
MNNNDPTGSWQTRSYVDAWRNRSYGDQETGTARFNTASSGWFSAAPFAKYRDEICTRKGAELYASTALLDGRDVAVIYI